MQFVITQVITPALKTLFNFRKLKGFLHTTLSIPFPLFRCKIAFYANDSQLSQRKTSFGYGQKVDFTKDLTSSPAATKYNLKSEFELNK